MMDMQELKQMESIDNRFFEIAWGKMRNRNRIWHDGNGRDILYEYLPVYADDPICQKQYQGARHRHGAGTSL